MFECLFQFECDATINFSEKIFAINHGGRKL